MEEQLREIADRQQVNVDKLVDLVKENESILAKMRVRYKLSFIQALYCSNANYSSAAIHIQ